MAEFKCLLCGLRRVYPGAYFASLMQTPRNDVPLANAASYGHARCLRELATYTDGGSLRRAAPAVLDLARLAGSEECMSMARGWVVSPRDESVVQPWLPK
jgi:hypothetical protein